MANSVWPTAKFRFSVDIDNSLKGISFQEVSGLEPENQIIEYRSSGSPEFSTNKLPGIAKYGNVTLKRGIFVNDNTFWNWHQEVSMNTIKFQTIIIRMLDESGQVVMKWILENARPTKITAADLNANGDEVAIDRIEIVHERITIQQG